MRKTLIYSVLVMLLFTISCRQEVSADPEMDKFRGELVLKTEVQQKIVFKDLKTNEKIRLWQSKISQILQQKLSIKQRILTKQILEELPKISDRNYDGDRILTLAIEMAKITPQDEFIRMFSMFENYNRNEFEYKGFDNSLIVNDLISFRSSVLAKNTQLLKESTNKNYLNSRLLPDCNCSWTCGFYNCTDNCNETENGCGFLGLQICTGRV